MKGMSEMIRNENEEMKKCPCAQSLRQRPAQPFLHFLIPHFSFLIFHSSFSSVTYVSMARFISLTRMNSSAEWLRHDSPGPSLNEGHGMSA